MPPAATAALLLAILAAAVATTSAQGVAAGAAQQAAATAEHRAVRGPKIAFELPPATDCSPADLPQITHRGDWRSRRDRTPAANVTMVTQLTLSRAKRLAALCVNYDGVIAAGVYMTLKTPGAGGGSGGTAAQSSAAARTVNSSGDGKSQGAAAGSGTGAARAGSDAAGQDVNGAALAGGGTTAAITRRLRAFGGSSSSSGSNGMHPEKLDGAASHGSGLHPRGGRRLLLRGISGAVRRLLGAGDAAASPDPIKAIEQAIQKLNRLHAKLEAEGRCQLDMGLYSEDHPAGELEPVYPINAVRNRALQMVDTKDVLLLDVDFMVGGGPIARIANYPGVQDALAAGDLLVLPAFEPAESAEFDMEPDQTQHLPPQDVVRWGIADIAEGLAVQAEAISGSKRDVVWMWRAGRLDIFHSYCIKCHYASEYHTWAESDRMFRARFENGYEPYVLMRYDMTPPYDERFKGYLVNKALQLRHLHRLGRRFMVHPGAWVVHTPHPRSRAFKAVKSLNLTDQIIKLERQAKVAMSEQRYSPHSIWTCKGGAGAAGSASSSSSGAEV